VERREGAAVAESTMSSGWAIDKRVIEIVRRDGRYRAAAYQFVFEALDYAVQFHGRVRRRPSDRHLTVPELLDGIRAFAVEQFGPFARTVLESMGIFETGDFGEIVFNLVDVGLLNAQDSDRKEQFAEVYSFREAFDERATLQRAV
jgi:uncharacterized repeat protein (TIGR04138 family)